MMLDFRYTTFLTLCQLKNYTRTAEALHITQPAVTQHIQYLEQYYNQKLFFYEKKKLCLTKAGKALENFVITLNSDTHYFHKTLHTIDVETGPISFGATLTIGEYIMPTLLKKLALNHKLAETRMHVNNTEVLLSKLENAEIDFVFLEGFFDKSKYASALFSLETFTPIAAFSSPYSKGNFSLENLLDARLILREKGSGTRDILEQILKERNLSINSFTNIWEIGNMHCIKELVSENIGISFLYEIAIKKEIERQKLAIIPIEDFTIKREFNFVYLKNSVHEKEYLKWFQLFLDYYSTS